MRTHPLKMKTLINTRYNKSIWGEDNRENSPSKEILYKKMKKIFSVLFFILIFTLMLTSCGLTMPRPEVKEGQFDVSVTYEVGGETKTLDLVYVCKYDGVKMTPEGTRYRAWNGSLVSIMMSR